MNWSWTARALSPHLIAVSFRCVALKMCAWVQQQQNSKSGFAETMDVLPLIFRLSLPLVDIARAAPFGTVIYFTFLLLILCSFLLRLIPCIRRPRSIVVSPRHCTLRRSSMYVPRMREQLNEKNAKETSPENNEWNILFLATTCRVMPQCLLIKQFRLRFGRKTKNKTCCARLQPGRTHAN